MEFKDSYLHNWVFHFNPYKQIWSAIPRDLYSAYWNDEKIEGIYRSTDIKTLLEALHKTDGNIKNLTYERA